MADIQSAAAEIRRGKKKKEERRKKEETTGQKYNGLPYSKIIPWLWYRTVYVVHNFLSIYSFKHERNNTARLSIHKEDVIFRPCGRKIAQFATFVRPCGRTKVANWAIFRPSGTENNTEHTEMQKQNDESDTIVL